MEGQHKMDLLFAVLTLIYAIAIQKGILHFENIEPQQMKMFYDSKSYIALTKSVFSSPRW